MTAPAVDDLAVRRVGALAWTLNRPYFDLAAAPGQTPLHAEHVGQARDNLLDRRFGVLGPVMVMTPLFRRLLVTETGLGEYGATRLADLPRELRSPAWQTAVDDVEHLSGLSDAHRLALGRLLMALTMYEQAAEVLGPAPKNAVGDGGAAAELVVASLMARYVTGAGDRRALVDDVRATERQVPSGTVAHVSAVLLLAALTATPGPDAGAAAEVLRGAYESAEAATAEFDEVDAARLRVRVLSLHAKLVTLTDPASAVELTTRGIASLSGLGADRPAVREALRRLLDRRCLLSRLTGDGDQLAFARRAVALDPVDSKAWLQLGNAHAHGGRYDDALAAYRRAAAFGPLYTGMAHYSAGVMLQRLGRCDEAVQAHLQALRVDPTSPSTASALRDLGEQLGLSYLRSVTEQLPGNRGTGTETGVRR